MEQPDEIAARIGYRREIPGSVEGERRALAEGAHDRGGLSLPVALDRGDVVVRVGDGHDAAGGVVTEGQEDRSRQSIARAEVAAVLVELVQLLCELHRHALTRVRGRDEVG